MNTERLTLATARALLAKDTHNRITNVASKGGRLSDADVRIVRRFIRREERKQKQGVSLSKEKQIKTIHPDTFEGDYEQRLRRRKVFLLRLEGATIREMAAELRASSATIVADLRSIDEQLNKQIGPLNATALINERLLIYEATRLMAMQELKEAESGMLKNQLLNTIASVTKLETELMQDAGIIPKTARKLQMSGPDGEPLPSAGLTPPVINIVIEQTAETQSLKEKFHGRN